MCSVAGKYAEKTWYFANDFCCILKSQFSTLCACVLSFRIYFHMIYVTTSNTLPYFHTLLYHGFLEMKKYHIEGFEWYLYNHVQKIRVTYIPAFFYGVIVITKKRNVNKICLFLSLYEQKNKSNCIKNNRCHDTCIILFVFLSNFVSSQDSNKQNSSY